MVFAQAPNFDADYATAWLQRIVPADDQRLLRFREILETHAGG